MPNKPNKRKRKNRSKKSSGIVVTAPQPPASANSGTLVDRAMLEEATSLPLPASFGDDGGVYDQPQLAEQPFHIAEAIVQGDDSDQELFSSSSAEPSPSHEGDDENDDDHKPGPLDVSIYEDAVQAMANETISPNHIIEDLINLESSKALEQQPIYEEEEQVPSGDMFEELSRDDIDRFVADAASNVDDSARSPVQETESVAFDSPSPEPSSLPELAIATDPSIVAAVSPAVLSQARTSPVSAMEELDDTAEECSPTKPSTSNAGLATVQTLPCPVSQSDVSNPEEDPPVGKAASKSPYDEVSPTTSNETKVTVTLEGKDVDFETKSDVEEPDVARHVYDGVKGVWIWGKTHIPFADLWMGLTESLAGTVLKAATGSDLQKMDEVVFKPRVNGLDKDFLNPVIHAVVDAILEDDKNKKHNPLHSILFSLLRPPVGFLIKSDVQETKPVGETSVEG